MEGPSTSYRNLPNPFVHFQITRDRTGLQQSILKVPNWLKNNDKSTHSNTLLSHDISDVTLPDEEVDGGGDEDQQQQHQRQLQSQTNISVVTGTPTSALLKNFNRSKSNIETFTSQPKIISTTNASLAAATGASTHAVKARTLAGDRGQADGGSNQQDSDFDEFSSQDEEDEPEPQHQQHNQQNQQQNFYQNAQEVQGAHNMNNSKDGGQVLGRCKALYSYTPKLYDELELSPGDVIEVHAKQEDGWWLGALRNQIGIFPATYVEECA